MSTAPRASSVEAAKIVDSTASRKRLPDIPNCEPRAAAGSGGYSSAGNA